MRPKANRFAPKLRDVNAAVSEMSDEKMEARILRTLSDKDSESIRYVRSLCAVATIFASEISDAGGKIEISCPKDEERRSLSSTLRSARVDRITLYPMTEEAFDIFSKRMKEVGKGVGEYIVYTWCGNRSEWEGEEVH